MPREKSHAFERCGRIPGIEKWHIQNFKPAKEVKGHLGTFSVKDTYLILHTKKEGENFAWDIHYWIGRETSKDDVQLVVSWAAELDNEVGGNTVQYKQVQDHEAKSFLQLFHGDVRYLLSYSFVEKNAANKLHKVATLYQIIGSRIPRLKQVKLNCSSLSKDGVFILDGDFFIHIWVGERSRQIERTKAIEFGKKLKHSYTNNEKTIKIVEESKDYIADDKFFRELGSRCPIKQTSPKNQDEKSDTHSNGQVILYRISDSIGVNNVEEVARPPIKKETLNSTDVFLLDTGSLGIFLWIGRKCSMHEKKAATSVAMNFMDIKKYPRWMPLTRIIEGLEPEKFKKFFYAWTNSRIIYGLGKVTIEVRLGKSENSFDASTLHQRTQRKSGPQPDDGGGTVQIWKVEEKDVIEWNEAQYGVFYDGDCYLILYKYRDDQDRIRYMIYIWQGLKSDQTEKSQAVEQAENLDESLGTDAIQIRAVQNKEPDHFLMIFQGKFIILQGKTPKGFKGAIASEDPTNYAGGKRFFHIRGSNEFNTKAIEVAPTASNLNSGDVFLLQTEDTNYVWEGKWASDDEKDFAEKAADCIAPEGDLVIMQEGYEVKEFWEFLDGKKPYTTANAVKEERKQIQPRLFHCTTESGEFKVNEILDFDQEDLCEEDVMLLDAEDELYVWVGKGANTLERRESLKTAMEYIKTDGNRSMDNTTILQVKQGYEPPNFTNLFHPWDNNKWSQGKSYEELKRQLGREEVEPDEIQSDEEEYFTIFKYEELLSTIPYPGVDVKNKEKHLSDEEFYELFGMTHYDFEGKPKWRQEMLKRKVNLL